MQQPLNEIREDLSQLVAMSGDLVRASQQQTRNLEIQTQQIGLLSEAITASRLAGEAQGQRMEQGFAQMRLGFDRLDQALAAQGQRMEQGFAEMRLGFDRLDQALEAQGQRMERGFAEMRLGFDRLDQTLDRLAEVTQSQGQQMLSVVQQLAQVLDRLVTARDR